MPLGHPRFAHARALPRWGEEHVALVLTLAMMRMLCLNHFCEQHQAAGIPKRPVRGLKSVAALTGTVGHRGYRKENLWGIHSPTLSSRRLRAGAAH